MGSSARPWQQLPGGYDPGRAAAGQPPAGNPGSQGGQQAPQPIPLPQTTLGAPTQQNTQGAPIFPENSSPLQQAPRPLPWERQQQAPPAQPQFQQQQPQFQQQAPQPQQQVPPGVDLNARIYGQNIPQELQGRTVGEVVGMINGLRQVHLSQMQQPAQQAPQAQITQSPAQPATPFDWKNPDQSIGRVVEEKIQNAIQNQLGPVLQPVLMQGQVAQANAAMQQAAAEIPGFQEMLPQIFERLQGIPPNILGNKETWKTAAKVVAGERVLQGQHPQSQPGMYPQQQVQPGQSPLPNLNSFYTEQPNQGGPLAPQGFRLSPEQARAADAMNISHADYAAWAVGVTR